MSNRDSDARYEAIQQGVPFFGSELLKRVHTSFARRGRCLQRRNPPRSRATRR